MNANLAAVAPLACLRQDHRGNDLDVDYSANSSPVAIYWDFENLHAALVEGSMGKVPMPNKTTVSSNKSRWLMSRLW